MFFPIISTMCPSILLPQVSASYVTVCTTQLLFTPKPTLLTLNIIFIAPKLFQSLTHSPFHVLFRTSIFTEAYSLVLERTHSLHDVSIHLHFHLRRDPFPCQRHNLFSPSSLSTFFSRIPFSYLLLSARAVQMTQSQAPYRLPRSPSFYFVHRNSAS